MNNKLAETVRLLSAKGYQLVPRDGNTKLPTIKWKKYHEQGYKNTQEEIEKWIKEGYEEF